MSEHRMCNANSVLRYHADCAGEVPIDAPVSLCKVHLRKVYAYVQQSMDIAGGTVFADGKFQMPKYEPRNPPVVYYIRNQQRIKIGWTGDLRQRLRGLHHDEVLAVEPGDGRLEKLRHKQFEADRLARRGEWFSMSEDLLAHIEMLRKHYPEHQEAA